mgnify:CR=1 FL=1
MKKILFLSLIGLTLACSSNKDGASDPTKTTKEFENPTGDLTTTNAKTIVQAGISANKILILRTPEDIFTFDNLEFDDCTETSGNSDIINWACVFNNVVQCTADGDTTVTDDDGKDFTSVDYADLDVICNENDPDEVALTVQGDLNFVRDTPTNNPVFCANVEFMINDDTSTFNGCRNSSGYLSVRLSGDNVIIRNMTINPGCTQITATIRDKDNTDDVVCTIAQTDGECDGPGNIETITNCEIN